MFKHLYLLDIVIFILCFFSLADDQTLCLLLINGYSFYLFVNWIQKNQRFYFSKILSSVITVCISYAIFYFSLPIRRFTVYVFVRLAPCPFKIKTQISACALICRCRHYLHDNVFTFRRRNWNIANLTPALLFIHLDFHHKSASTNVDEEDAKSFWLACLSCKNEFWKICNEYYVGVAPWCHRHVCREAISSKRNSLKSMKSYFHNAFSVFISSSSIDYDFLFTKKVSKTSSKIRKEMERKRQNKCNKSRKKIVNERKKKKEILWVFLQSITPMSMLDHQKKIPSGWWKRKLLPIRKQKKSSHIKSPVIWGEIGIIVNTSFFLL